MQYLKKINENLDNDEETTTLEKIMTILENSVKNGEIDMIKINLKDMRARMARALYGKINKSTRHSAVDFHKNQHQPCNQSTIL